MRIQSLAVQNYRSLHNVRMEKIGNLVVLLGENGSGKSSLLEALSLFFSGFRAQITSPLEGTSDWLWFDRDTRTPIRFEVVLELGPAELDDLIEGFRFDKKPEAVVTMVRTLASNDGGATAVWQTEEVRVGDRSIVEAGTLVMPEARVGSGAQAEPTEAEIEAEEELPSSLLRELAGQITESFELVPAIRHHVPSVEGFPERDTLLPGDVRERISGLLQTQDRDEMRTKARLIGALRRAVPEGLEVAQGNLQMPEGDISFPIRLVGGGVQELLGLLLRVMEAPDIIGIEEPESHLHPHFERVLLGILQEVASHRQVLLATHSEVFVDSVDPGSVWVVRKREKETHIIRAGAEAEVAEALKELGYSEPREMLLAAGAKPSVTYMTRRLLLVGRPIDKWMLPLFAKKVGVDFESRGVVVRDLAGGIGSEKHALRIWGSMTEGMKSEVVMIIGPRAMEATQDLRSKRPDLLPPDKVLGFTRETIFDYLPPDKVKVALRGEPFRIHHETVEKLDLSPPMLEKVETLLKEKDKAEHGWEWLIAQRVVPQMTADDVPYDLRSLIERADHILSPPHESLGL